MAFVHRTSYGVDLSGEYVNAAVYADGTTFPADPTQPQPVPLYGPFTLRPSPDDVAAVQGMAPATRSATLQARLVARAKATGQAFLVQQALLQSDAQAAANQPDIPL